MAPQIERLVIESDLEKEVMTGNDYPRDCRKSFFPPKNLF